MDANYSLSLFVSLMTARWAANSAPKHSSQHGGTYDHTAAAIRSLLRELGVSDESAMTVDERLISQGGYDESSIRLIVLGMLADPELWEFTEDDVVALSSLVRLTDHERVQRIRTAAAFPKHAYLRAALVEHAGMSDYTARAISGRVRSGYGLKDAVGETGADYVLSADDIGPVVDPSWPFADEITDGQRTLQIDLDAINWLLRGLGAPPVS